LYYYNIQALHSFPTRRSSDLSETILVVDDNKEIVYSISELLKYEGYQTVAAYDGMQALDALEKHKIDLILLDVMMPRLNGLSALDRKSTRLNSSHVSISYAVF